MKVLIDSLDHQGRGIGRIDKKTIFVENALPGEIVDVNITKDKKNYSEAIVNSYIKESDYRREAPCKYYGLCGGCNIMHMSYDMQLIFKKDKVKNILKRFASLDVDPLIEPSNELSYRNKITLHKDNNYGLLKEETNSVVSVDKCLICEDKINEVLNGNYESNPLIIRTNSKDVITSDNNDYLYMNINDYIFRIDAFSFFQVNSYISSKILTYIEENMPLANNALDLYSGVGFLTTIVSKKSKNVYSIEVNNNSYENAVYNMKVNNINNVTLMNGKVEDKIKEINEKIDLIVTDPPRSGMDEFTINTILDLKPSSIVYMSCDPMTLARDLNILKEVYSIKNIKLFDMFPNTYHIETVCILERK